MTGRPQPRMYPFAPIDKAAAVTDRDLAAVLHISYDQLRRARRTGLTADQADRYAVRLGLHPSALWESWFADALTVHDDLYVNFGGWRPDYLWRHPEYA